VDLTAVGALRHEAAKLGIRLHRPALHAPSFVAHRP
jgi:hypothetical protein